MNYRKEKQPGLLERLTEYAGSDAYPFHMPGHKRREIPDGIPVETKRCVVRLDGKKAAKKVERWQQIAESAAKQSKRMLIPSVHPVMTFKDALAWAKEMDVRLIPYELAQGIAETKALLSEIRPGQSIGIFIGPEGGFEEKEIEAAIDAGVSTITLGKRILRTETAGLAILSVLMFQLEQ